MSAAPVIRIDSPVSVRAARTVRDYADFAADAAALDTALGRLPRHHSKETVAGWRALAAQGEIETLAEALIVAHYDPAYRRAGGGRPAEAIVEIGSLDDAALAAAADAVAVQLERLSGR